MDILTLLNWWFSHSLYYLFYSVIRLFGFENPYTVLLLAAYNIMAILYLYILTAVSYLVLKEKAWKMALLVSFVWLFYGFLIFAEILQQGKAAIMLSVFPHACIEFMAIFYWIKILKNACFTLLGIKLETYDFKDYLHSKGNLKKILEYAKNDFLAIFSTILNFSRNFWRKETKKKFLLILILILFAALLETYLAPILAGFGDW